MIQQGPCLGDGQGFLTIRVSFCSRAKLGGPGLGPYLSGCSAAKPLPVQSIAELRICKDTKRMIVRPASSLVDFFLRISRNGFEGQLCKCNLCVTVYSFVLCGEKNPPPCSLNCNLKQVAAVTQETFVSWIVCVKVQTL